MGILDDFEATSKCNENEMYDCKLPKQYYIPAAYLNLVVIDIEYMDLELDFCILHKYQYEYLILK